MKDFRFDRILSVGSARVGRSAALFAASAVIAQSAGIEKLGQYYSVLAFATLGAQLLLFGLDSRLTREISVYHGIVSNARLYTDLFTVLGLRLLFLLGVAICVAAFELVTLGHALSTLLVAFALAVLLVSDAMLRGLSRPVLGAITQLLVPAVCLLMVSGLQALFGGGLTSLIFFTYGGSLVISLAVFTYAVRSLDQGNPRAPSDYDPTSLKIRSTWQLGLSNLISSSLVPQLPIMSLTVLAPASAVGVFAVLNRLAALQGMFVGSIGAVMAPKVAQAMHRRDHSQIRKIINSSALLAGLGAGFYAVLVVMIFPLIFAAFAIQGTSQNENFLSLLLFVYWVSACFGPAGIYLIMAGRDSSVLFATSASLITLAPALAVTLKIDWLLVPLALLAASLTKNVILMTQLRKLWRRVDGCDA